MCLPVHPYKIAKEWVGPGGLLCAVSQARAGGNHCAYVRVGPSHPLYGKDYDDINGIACHGGLTFAAKEPCVEHPDGQGWWFGFDFAHFGDALVDPDYEPQTEKELLVRDIMGGFDLRKQAHFWTVDECAKEAEDLAEQLFAVQVKAELEPVKGLAASMGFNVRVLTSGRRKIRES